MYADSRVAFYKRCLERKPGYRDPLIYAEQVIAEEQENEGEKFPLHQTEIPEDQASAAFDTQEVETDAEQKNEEDKKSL